MTMTIIEADQRLAEDAAPRFCSLGRAGSARRASYAHSIR